MPTGNNRRLNITRITRCGCCANEDVCNSKHKYVYACSSADNSIVHFKNDAEKRERLTEKRNREIERFTKSFDRVRPEQIKVNSDSTITFTALPLPEMMRNSRQDTAIVADDSIAYRKWCVQCGEAFETVNSRRHICNGCWKEICERLGICFGEAYDEESRRFEYAQRKAARE